MDNCRICGGIEYREVLTKCDKTYKSTWVECAKCKVQRIFPYPIDEELRRYYNDHYLQKECLDGVSHLKRFHPDYRSTVHNEYSFSLADVGLDTASLAHKKILDFGCADGIFLDWLRMNGIRSENLFGVDLGEDMVKIAAEKGYQVATFEMRHELYRRKMDLVTLWDCPEHLLDIKNIVSGLTEAMHQGTLLLIQTPRVGLLSEILGERFAHYLPVEHVHLFPRESLVRFLQDFGFRLLRAASFGANVPAEVIPSPYKEACDRLAKVSDQGATQVLLFQWEGRAG